MPRSLPIHARPTGRATRGAPKNVSACQDGSCQRQCHSYGVPRFCRFCPVNNMQSLFSDPQVLHRDMVAEVPHPTIGTLRLGGIPIKYSETPGTVRLPPPLLGEHTDKILTDVLGYPQDKIAALRQQGAI
ncbi:MAG: CoA transferase [Phycisphaerae bacterium]